MQRKQRAYQALDDAQCRAAKPRDTVYRLNDGLGLSLQIQPKHQGGHKSWVFRYRFMRLQRMMSLGGYPEVSLKEARRKVLEQRVIVDAGEDPVKQRKASKLKKTADALQTFGSVSREWLERNKATWSGKHYARYAALLERVLLPKLGPLPIHQIDVPVLLAALKEEETRTDTNARKARTAASLVFRYAIASGRATIDPAKATIDALQPKPAAIPRKALSIDQVGPTLRAMDERRAGHLTRTALLLLLYTGLRDWSVRGAKWGEIDFDNAQWTVAAERMKGRAGKKKPHTVPLPKQAIQALKELGPGHPDAYIFPNQKRARGCMAENTMCTALRLYSGVPDVTAHGCRSLITDALYEHGFRTEAIEVQMAHDIGTLAREHNEPVKSADPKVRSAYLRSGFLDLRRTMMQWWADYMDALKANKPAPKSASNVRKLRALVV